MRDSARTPPLGQLPHSFALLWSWKVVCDIWLGSHGDLHANTRILLHFTQFMVRSQKWYQPYGPWEHIANSIWREDRASAVDEEDDDAKFVAKRRHCNAQYVTFICVLIAFASIPMTSMSVSSHLFISRCHMVVSCGKYMMCGGHRGHPFGLSLGMCNDSVLFLPCACVLPQRWVDFRVVTGELNYYLARCRNIPFFSKPLSTPKPLEPIEVSNALLCVS